MNPDPNPHRQPRRRAALLALCCLTGLLAGPAAQALDSDRQRPIEIEADRVDIDEHQGLSLYSGHVRFSQGSLHIQADSISLELANGTLKRLLIKGQPAVLTQTPEGKQEDMRAQAQQMEYLTGQNQVTLKGRAEVRQGGNTFRSETIHYDLGKDTLSAGQTEDSERVRITIQPPAPKAPAP